MSKCITAQLLPNCPARRFTCTNKKCVSGNSSCDGGIDHCGDNSDETVGCEGTQNKKCNTSSSWQWNFIHVTFKTFRFIFDVLSLIYC